MELPQPHIVTAMYICMYFRAAKQHFARPVLSAPNTLRLFVILTRKFFESSYYRITVIWDKSFWAFSFALVTIKKNLYYFILHFRLYYVFYLSRDKLNKIKKYFWFSRHTPVPIQRTIKAGGKFWEAIKSLIAFLDNSWVCVLVTKCHSFDKWTCNKVCRKGLILVLEYILCKCDKWRNTHIRVHSYIQ